MTTLATRSSHTALPLESFKAWKDLSKPQRRVNALQALQANDLDTLTSLVAAYITMTKGTPDEKTLALYRTQLAKYLDAHHGHVHKIDLETASAFIREQEQHSSPQTVAKVKTACKWLHSALLWVEAFKDLDGAIMFNPFEHIYIKRDPTPVQDKFSPYTDNDLQALLEHGNLAPDTKVMLLLSAHAGLRASEVCALRWQDIDVRNHKLKVLEGKGGKTRTVGMTRTLSLALTALETPDTPPDSLVVQTDRKGFSYRLEKACELAGITFKGKAVHGLRHYAGTKAYMVTGDIYKTAMFLGHSDISTSQRYAKMYTSGFTHAFREEFQEVLGR